MLSRELKFTNEYKKHQESDIYMREAMCLKVMFEDFFTPIEDGDLIAGRVDYPSVGFGTENTTGGSLYYLRAPLIEKNVLDNPECTEQDARAAKELMEFWKEEQYINLDNQKSYSQMVNALPKDIYDRTTNVVAEMGGRVAGCMVDYDKLVRVGIVGLIEEIKLNKDKKDSKLYDAMLEALENFKEVCIRYSNQAKEQAKNSDETRATQLIKMSEALINITIDRPKTTYEAIQLVWLYSLASLCVNYGRMDEYLGDLYVHDIDNNISTESEILEYLKSMWKLISARKTSAHEFHEFNTRIILGGKGRRNPENADRFAPLAMEVTRQVLAPEPQLTLRFYKGQNPKLMEKALDVIGEGCTFPMLYNDDVNIPSVMNAFGVSEEDAKHYLPYGCGEYMLYHRSVGSPNCSLNLTKALEITLNNGKCMLTDEKVGLDFGDAENFETFEDLLNAYKKQTEYFIEALAVRHSIEYEVERSIAALLYISALYDDCIEKGKGVLEGGARYRGGLIESFGIVNTGDALSVIKELVYEKKEFTLSQVVDMMKNNYEGYESEYKKILNSPKFGNDIDSVDNIVNEINKHVSLKTKEQADKLGLDFFLVVNINNWFNVEFGKSTAPSMDGRRKNAPLANGNTPTAGMDKNGVTAFLNSISKIDSSNHAGYTQNMKFSKQMFNNDRSKLKILLDTYFENNGAQAMITVVNRKDMENAMNEPEKYQNLIVRVGGFSARFVELSRDIQIDLINRTLHE